MVIALAYRDGVRIPPWAARTLVAAGLAVFAWSWSQGHFFGPDSVLRVFAWGLPALAIVGAFALSEQPVAANLFWRVCGFLGDASYSLYLVHTLAVGVPVMVLGRFIAPASAPWFYLAGDPDRGDRPGAARPRVSGKAADAGAAAPHRTARPDARGHDHAVAANRAITAKLIVQL